MQFNLKFSCNAARSWLSGAAGAVALICVGTIEPAHAVTVKPGQTLQIVYSVAGPNSVPGETGAGGRAVDTLEFVQTDPGTTFTDAVAQLYNGTTLLGTVDFFASNDTLFGFTAPGAAFSVGSLGTVNDWSSLINGTNDLTLDLTFDATINVSIDPEALGVGFFGDEILNATNQPTFVSDSVVSTTPLPTTLPLLATGLGALGLFGWLRKRQARAVPA